MEIYDFLIIGAGTAGASGAMYASRLNLKSAMLGELPGGLITTTHLVENWPGIKSISGPDLASALLDHATSFGVPLINETVTSITPVKPLTEQLGENRKTGFIVKTAGNQYGAKTILLATGSSHRKLGIPSELAFENRGVSYCALCDGAFFKNKPVAVVGGGDSAAKEALLLAEHCERVYVISRTSLHPEPVTLGRVKANSRITLIDNVEVAEILGDSKVRQVRLTDGKMLDTDAVFIAIGLVPHSELAGALGVELNARKEIVVNRHAETNIAGVFAAGDVCDSEFKQAITGSAEAVTASFFAYEYLQDHEVVMN